MNYAKMVKPKKLAGGGFLSNILGGAGATSKMLPGVGTAASLMSGMLANGIAQDKASKQRTAMLNQLWEEKSIEDAQLLDDYDTNGQYVEYFATGGKLPTSSIKGKYATIGGKTKPIAKGVEEVEGNTHEQKTIDNSYGVTLVDKQNGIPTANVEDEEVIVDGKYVFSDRLSPDGKQTFAKKMKTLAMKRKKVEEDLSEEQIDTKIRNGLKRTLEGLDLEEAKLMSLQESMNQVLAGQESQMLAYGGGIGDPTNPTPTAKPKPKVAFNPSSEDFLPVRKIQKITNPDGSQGYQYFYDKLPNEEGYSEDLHSHTYTSGEYINKTSKQHPEYSVETAKYLSKTNNRLGRDIGVNYSLIKQAPKLANGGDIPSLIGGTFNSLGRRVLRGVGKGTVEELDGEVGEAYKSEIGEIYKPKEVEELDGEVGEAYKSEVTPADKAARDTPRDKGMFDYLAPTILDNAMNLGLTIGSPKLAKPILKRARGLKTNINVNPQVASVRGAVESGVDNIMSNTSNSNIARAGASSLRLRGAEQLGSIYANKENMETQLKNSDTMNRQGVDFANVDTANNQNMLEFTRRNDIASRLSANMADLSKNVGEAQTKTQLDNYHDEVMLLDLLNDKTGDKARVMKRNPYMRRSSMLRAALEAENKRLNRN